MGNNLHTMQGNKNLPAKTSRQIEGYFLSTVVLQ
jgi:hypothetical protein